MMGQQSPCAEKLTESVPELAVPSRTLAAMTITVNRRRHKVMFGSVSQGQMLVKLKKLFYFYFCLGSLQVVLRD